MMNLSAARFAAAALLVAACDSASVSSAETTSTSAETASAEAASSNASSSALVPVEMEIFVDDGTPIPRFMVDAAWPKLPADQIIGQTSGLAVDGDDNVWILQRPNSLGPTEAGAAMEPPIAVCCRPAPHVIQFSPEGDVVTAWGGPEHAPDIDGVNQWPVNVHGLFVDTENTVWIGGNGDDDHVVLNFTADGDFIRQFGQRGVTRGNLDRESLGNPSDIHYDAASGEVHVSDGYINKRVIGFDTSTDGFKRFWGANGVAPDAPTREGAFDVSQATSTSDGGADPEAAQFGDIVHCVNRTSDGYIYVCDRRNNRVQVFRAEGESVELVDNIVIAAETGGTRSASDVAFSPDETYVYIADMMNGRVWILERATHRILAAFGRNGRYPGQFIWLHSVATDSEGNVFTSEVSTGRRVQRFVYMGAE